MLRRRSETVMGMVAPGEAGSGVRAEATEASARALLAELTATERGAAVVSASAPPDILTGTGRVADLQSVTGATLAPSTPQLRLDPPQEGDQA